MGAELVALVFTSGWASGVNAYAAVLVLGLLGRYAGLDAAPDVLSRPEVLLGAGALYLVEAVADKIPYVDSAWDALHTAIRPTVGAVLAAMLSGEVNTGEQAVAIALGGTSALASHAVKASIRLAANASPEPFSNIALSLLEDGAVAAVLALIMVAPWVAAVAAAILLLVGLVVAVLVWRTVRRGLRRWRARRGGAAADYP